MLVIIAFVHGKTIYVFVGSDISAYCNKADFPKSADTAETSTFGHNDKTYLPGLRGATFSIEGIWDPAVDAILDPLLGTIVTGIVYKPQGTGAGNVVYTFDACMTSYAPPGSITEAVKFTAAFTITGVVVRTSP